MGMNFYAAAISNEAESIGPVIPFECWDKEILAEDADARYERGEDAFIPNPEFREHGGMNLARGNAFALIDVLGIPQPDGEGIELEIGPAQVAVARAMCRVSNARMQHYLHRLNAVLATGRELGATHMVVT